MNNATKQRLRLELIVLNLVFGKKKYQDLIKVTHVRSFGSMEVKAAMELWQRSV